jgi:trichothecene 3-O-acetyltransferase
MGSINNDSLVYASTNVKKQTIKLSLTDAYSPKIWAKQTLFWTLKDPSVFHSIYDILRQGLARVLTDVPALTGTVGRGSEDPRDLVINVPSNGHVVFTKVDLSETDDVPDYATLSSRGWPMTDVVAPFSPLGTMSQIFEGAAFFTAQLNILRGGFALCFAINHLLVDGASIAEVEELWAKHTGDVCNGKEFQSHRIGIPDAEIKERLSTPIEGAKEFEHPNWALFPTEKTQVNLPKLTPSKETLLGVFEAAKKDHLANVKQQAEDVKWCVWYFSAQCLAQLKKDASSEDKSQWISTVDALVGLFWARTAHALRNASKGHEVSVALFPINIRHRLQPPLPSRYIGNAVDIVFLECHLAELEAEGSAGIQSAARAVRKAVSGWDQSLWESWLTKAATMSPEQSIVPNALALLNTHNIGFNDFSVSIGGYNHTAYLRHSSDSYPCKF